MVAILIVSSTLKTSKECKAQQYFVSSSCMFLDKETLHKIWLNRGLNLTIFSGTGPRE